MSADVELKLSETVQPGTIQVAGIAGERDPLVVFNTPDKGLALQILNKRIQAKHGLDVKPKITGPRRMDFDTWLGMYLAARTLENKLDHVQKDHEGVLQEAAAGRIVDTAKLAAHHKSVFRLVAYAQRERKRTGMPSQCPIPQRLSSLHRALVRLFHDPADVEKWKLAWEQIESSFSGDRDPFFWGPTEEDFSRGNRTNQWLLLALNRLKSDRAAYERDVKRAIGKQGIGYAMLPRSDGTWAPTEMIRIEKPESLLFEVWAWEDVENSKDFAGFPLVWIDKGWGDSGFEIHVNPDSGFERLEASKMTELNPDYVASDGFSLFWKEPDATERVWIVLKRCFFQEDEVRFTDYKSSEDGKLTDGKLTETTRQVRIASLIMDSDLRRPAEIPTQYKIARNTWRFCEIRLAKGLDIWGTWAGDEVARILYSALRPAEPMWLPNDFRDHITRQDRLVSVWTREGVAVAYEDKLPDHFEDKFKEIFLLRLDLEAILNPEEKNGNKDVDPPVAKRHAQLCRELAQNPEFRPLRTLFERTQPQELFNAWRDMSQAEEINDSDQRHGLLEIGILVVYLTELWDTIGRLILDEHKWLLLILMFVCSALGVWVAHHLLHLRKRTLGGWGILLMFVMLSPFLFALGWLGWPTWHHLWVDVEVKFRGIMSPLLPLGPDCQTFRGA